MTSDEIKQALESHVCRCGCHKEGSSMIHCTPCCYVCGRCSRRIEANYYHEHGRICGRVEPGVSTQSDTAPKDPAR